MADPSDRVVGRAARRRLSGGRSGASVPDGRWSAVPAPRLIVFLTFTVILATLLDRALPLPRWYVARRRGGRPDAEETLARQRRFKPRLRRLDTLASEPWLPRMLTDKLRIRYEHMLKHLPQSLDPADLDHGVIAAHERARREILEAQRQAISACAMTGSSGTTHSDESSATSTSKSSAPRFKCPCLANGFQAMR